ncbi:hypothetical protein DIPPA_13311 [Diplonema papillatum]|nr:hypothetical protein DIPPA_13311 [Diplonema papillatum]
MTEVTRFAFSIDDKGEPSTLVLPIRGDASEKTVGDLIASLQKRLAKKLLASSHVPPGQRPADDPPSAGSPHSSSESSSFPASAADVTVTDLLLPNGDVLTPIVNDDDSLDCFWTGPGTHHVHARFRMDPSTLKLPKQPPSPVLFLPNITPAAQTRAGEPKQSKPSKPAQKQRRWRVTRHGKKQDADDASPRLKPWAIPDQAQGEAQGGDGLGVLPAPAEAGSSDAAARPVMVNHGHLGRPRTGDKRGGALAPHTPTPPKPQGGQLASGGAAPAAPPRHYGAAREKRSPRSSNAAADCGQAAAAGVDRRGGAKDVEKQTFPRNEATGHAAAAARDKRSPRNNTAADCGQDNGQSAAAGIERGGAKDVEKQILPRNEATAAVARKKRSPRNNTAADCGQGTGQPAAAGIERGAKDVETQNSTRNEAVKPADSPSHTAASPPGNNAADSGQGNGQPVAAGVGSGAKDGESRSHPLDEPAGLKERPEAEEASARTTSVQKPPPPRDGGAAAAGSVAGHGWRPHGADRAANADDRSVSYSLVNHTAASSSLVMTLPFESPGSLAASPPPVPPIASPVPMSPVQASCASQGYDTDLNSLATEASSTISASDDCDSLPPLDRVRCSAVDGYAGCEAAEIRANPRDSPAQQRPTASSHILAPGVSRQPGEVSEAAKNCANPRDSPHQRPNASPHIPAPEASRQPDEVSEAAKNCANPCDSSGKRPTASSHILVPGASRQPDEVSEAAGIRADPRDSAAQRPTAPSHILAREASRQPEEAAPGGGIGCEAAVARAYPRASPGKRPTASSHILVPGASRQPGEVSEAAKNCANPRDSPAQRPNASPHVPAPEASRQPDEVSEAAGIRADPRDSAAQRPTAPSHFLAREASRQPEEAATGGSGRATRGDGSRVPLAGCPAGLRGPPPPAAAEARTRAAVGAAEESAFLRIREMAERYFCSFPFEPLPQEVGIARSNAPPSPAAVALLLGEEKERRLVAGQEEDLERSGVETAATLRMAGRAERMCLCEEEAIARARTLDAEQALRCTAFELPATRHRSQAARQASGRALAALAAEEHTQRASRAGEQAASSRELAEIHRRFAAHLAAAENRARKLQTELVAAAASSAAALSAEEAEARRGIAGAQREVVLRHNIKAFDAFFARSRAQWREVEGWVAELAGVEQRKRTMYMRSFSSGVGSVRAGSQAGTAGAVRVGSHPPSASDRPDSARVGTHFVFADDRPDSARAGLHFAFTDARPDSAQPAGFAGRAFADRWPGGALLAFTAGNAPETEGDPHFPRSSESQPAGRSERLLPVAAEPRRTPNAANSRREGGPVFCPVSSQSLRHTLLSSSSSRKTVTFRSPVGSVCSATDSDKTESTLPICEPID